MGNAVVEIVLMLLGAFGFGFLVAWLLFKDKKEVEVVEKVIEKKVADTTEINKLEGLLRASESEASVLKNALSECNSKTLKLEAELSNMQSVEKPVEITPPVPVMMAHSTAMPSPTKDDLKIVEGIGPKIEELLNKGGIYSFLDLAGTDPEKLREILHNAGPRYQMHNPTTWPKQATLASEGNWDELKTYQGSLNAGKTE